MIALLLVVDIVGGNVLVSFAIRRGGAQGDEVMPEQTYSDEAVETFNREYDAIRKATKAWREQTACEAVQIVSSDGLTLRGDLFLTDKASHLWLIAIHGYTGRRGMMNDYAAANAARDINVMAPDMRAHGESDGTYIGMGWLDRKDILQWIGLILERDPDAEIVLHGVSMGGATVMMTAGETLPANVKAAVEDCGYTSVWDIFRDEMGYLFHLPAFPLLHTASAFAKLRAGYSFTEASALAQISHAQIPVFFVHGSRDNFVATEMVYKVYDACPTDKDLMIVEGAGHGLSLYLGADAYMDRVFSFIGKYVTLEEAGE